MTKASRVTRYSLYSFERRKNFQTSILTTFYHCHGDVGIILSSQRHLYLPLSSCKTYRYCDTKQDVPPDTFDKKQSLTSTDVLLQLTSHTVLKSFVHLLLHLIWAHPQTHSTFSASLRMRHSCVFVTCNDECFAFNSSNVSWISATNVALHQNTQNTMNNSNNN